MMLAALAIVGILGTLGTPSNSVATEFPVVAVGDSILYNVHPDWWPDDWHIDAQPSRNPNTPGDVFNAGDVPTTTYEAVAANIPLVAPGGVFILQDVAAATVTLEQWMFLVADVVTALPDDRCLVVVTGYYPDAAGANMVEQVAQNDELLAIAENQPCHAVVDWAGQATEAGMLDPDGVHPSIAGDFWLIEALASATQ